MYYIYGVIKMSYWLLRTDFVSRDKGLKLTFFDDVKGRLISFRNDKSLPFVYTKLTKNDLMSYIVAIEDEEIRKMYYNENIRDLNTDNVEFKEGITKIDPFSRKTVKLNKIIFRKSYFRSTRKGTDLLKFLPEKFIYNDQIKYASQFLLETGLKMGMPYTLKDLSLKFDMTRMSNDNEEIEQIEVLKKYDEQIYDYFMPLFLADFPKISDYVISLDIEVDMDNKQALNPNNSGYPISSIAFYSKAQSKVFILSNETRGREKDDYDKFDWENCELEMFHSERELLFEAMKYLVGSPEIFVTGYNLDGFDFPYLRNRMKVMNLSFEDIEDNKVWKTSVAGTKMYNSMKIRNKFVIDLHSFFSNLSIKNYAFKNRYENLKLTTVTNALLGEEKYEFESSITDLSSYELAYYNYVDTKITYNLSVFDDEIVFRLMFMFQRLSLLDLESVNRRRISALINNFIETILHIKNMFTPNKHMMHGKSKKPLSKGKGKTRYKGAWVFNPEEHNTVGVWFDVVLTDFTSLYPSEIKERNICFTTLNCHHEECKSNKVPTLSHHICTKQKGVVPEAIGFIKDLRANYFKPKKDIGQNAIVEQALKVFINSIYGVLGDEVQYFFYLPAAESTTAWGYYDVNRLKDFVEQEIGLKVVAGDTDSIFIHNPTEEQLRKIINYSHEVLKIELEAEALLKGMVIYKKKNYIKIFNDRVTVMGMVAKKRNAVDFVKDCFAECVKEIGYLAKDNVEIVTVRITEIIIKYYKMLINETVFDNGFTLDNFKIKTQLGKELKDYDTKPLIVRVAYMLGDYINEKFEHQYLKTEEIIKAGRIIEYLYVSENIVRNEGKTPVLPIEMIGSYDKEKVLNYKKYSEIFLNNMDQLMVPFKINRNVVKNFGTTVDMFL